MDMENGGIIENGGWKQIERVKAEVRVGGRNGSGGEGKLGIKWQDRSISISDEKVSIEVKDGSMG